MNVLVTRILRIAALALFIGLAGCVSSGTNFDESRASQIKKGVTTETDLYEMFGKPNQRTSNSDGMTILTWMYVQSKIKGQSFIPFAGAFLGGSDSTTKTLTATLGADGKVTDYTVSGGGTETRNNRN